MTKILKTAMLGEIQTCLVELGSGNHLDNMRAISKFSKYFLVELSEAEFFALVFLQNDHVISICPRGDDRSLRSVAHRALASEYPNLHANWNLDEVINGLKSILLPARLSVH